VIEIRKKEEEGWRKACTSPHRVDEAELQTTGSYSQYERIEGLEPGCKYVFRILARNGVGDSAFSTSSDVIATKKVSEKKPTEKKPTTGGKRKRSQKATKTSDSQEDDEEEEREEVLTSPPGRRRSSQGSVSKHQTQGKAEDCNVQELHQKAREAAANAALLRASRPVDVPMQDLLFQGSPGLACASTDASNSNVTQGNVVSNDNSATGAAPQSSVSNVQPGGGRSASMKKGRTPQRRFPGTGHKLGSN